MLSVKLAPLFQDEQLDNNGLPLSGGQLSWYVAGTSTPVSVYTDNTGVTAHTQPIILNTRGEPPNPIWLPTGVNYKAALADSLGNPIRTIDNIPAINDFNQPSVSEWVVYSGTPTYQDATHFTMLGDQTVAFKPARRLQMLVGGSFQYGTIVTSVFAAGITTITVLNDTSAITNGLTQVYYGILNSVNTSIPGLIKSPVSITAAATTAIGAANADIVNISGTTTITAFDTQVNGLVRRVIWLAATPITYNASSLQLIGNVSRVNGIGDTSTFVSLGSGNWIEVDYQRRGELLPVGSVIATLAAVAPPGFMAFLTAPGTISRVTYANLFAVIGTIFGAGDGSTTFGAPWCAQDYAFLHNPSGIGAQIVGAVISHNHTDAGHFHNFTASNAGGVGIGNGSYIAITTQATSTSYANIQNTGGSANLAAGLRVLYCVKY